MAVLRNSSSGQRTTVEAEHLVGRSPRSALAIAETYVSAQHAAIRWTGERWEVKDLGSRNGTFVGEVKVVPGEHHPLRAGSRLRFGHASQEWVLEDDGAPSVMVVPLGGGEGIVGESNLVAIPSTEEPLAAIYRGSSGQWLLERQDEPLAPIEDQDTFEVAGKIWRFCCPSVLFPTSSPTEQFQLSKLGLHFFVSRDEEHVEMRALTRESVSLGARNHNYLLLTLARMRLRDLEQGIPETACGWVYQDELVKQLDITPNQLNVEVFRIRQQFASLNLQDSATVIERRPRARQMRIGVADLKVEIL